jgi:hypothetical protein
MANGRKRKTGKDVDLLGTVEVLHEHLTAALCTEVFQGVRGKERQRLWTLERLAEFWIAVILRAPPSLSHALAEAVGGTSAYPAVAATPQAFFARSQHLRWEFFADLFAAFRARAVAAEPPRFAAAHRKVLDRFAGVHAVDGSKLDAVARRLKLLWDDRRVPLPGSLVAFYDLRRGTLDQLAFNPKAHCAELHDAIAGLDALPAGALVLGDRLYGVPALFAALSARGLWGVTRRNRVPKLHKIRRLSRVRHAGGVLEDWEVLAGTGQSVAPQPLRWIRWKKGRKTREVVTNLLDPARLSAAEALALYPLRWKVERLFFDLKEVLNLHRFYAANANAVGMQVYAAAIVYTAMRVAQGRIAAEVGVEPEALSVPKLFPKIAAASNALTTAELMFEATRRLNRHVRLLKPDWRKLPFATTSLDSVRVQPRNPKRRRRRYCAARRHSRSLPQPKTPD